MWYTHHSREHKTHNRVPHISGLYSNKYIYRQCRLIIHATSTRNCEWVEMGWAFCSCVCVVHLCRLAHGCAHKLRVTEMGLRQVMCVSHSFEENRTSQRYFVCFLENHIATLVLYYVYFVDENYDRSVCLSYWLYVYKRWNLQVRSAYNLIVTHWGKAIYFYFYTQ